MGRWALKLSRTKLSTLDLPAVCRWQHITAWCSRAQHGAAQQITLHRSAALHQHARPHCSTARHSIRHHSTVAFSAAVFCTRWPSCVAYIYLMLKGTMTNVAAVKAMTTADSKAQSANCSSFDDIAFCVAQSVISLSHLDTHMSTNQSAMPSFVHAIRSGSVGGSM